MSIPEVIPDGINRLADIAEKSPGKLKEAAKNATLDELNQLSRVIVDVRKLTVTPEIVNALQKRFDVLKQEQKIDQNLTNLQSRLDLVRLLEIKAGAAQKDASFLETAVASRLRGLAEWTKDIPGVNFFTGFFKDISGRGVERKFFEFLSFFEKAPSAVVGAIGGMTLGPVGSLVSTINFGGFASRKVMEFDVRDAVDQERLVGETITFGGVSKDDMTAFNAFVQKRIADKQPVSGIKELAKSRIALLRKERAGSLTLTMADMLKAPDELKTSADQQAATDRMKGIAEKWKTANVEKVKFGVAVSANKVAGKWEITVPESGLKDGEPVTTGTKKLKEALTIMSAAESIVIEDPGAQKNPLTLDYSDRSITLTTDTIISDTFNRAFNHSDQKLAKIVFATPIQLRNGEMFAEWNGGTLLLAAHNLRTDSLEHIESMLPLDPNLKNGALFRYNAGISSWQPYIPPVSAA